jgi:hypothetical protein
MADASPRDPSPPDANAPSADASDDDVYRPTTAPLSRRASKWLVVLGILVSLAIAVGSVRYLLSVTSEAARGPAADTTQADTTRAP